jgi:hypothetical protein
MACWCSQGGGGGGGSEFNEGGDIRGCQRSVPTATAAATAVAVQKSGS